MAMAMHALDFDDVLLLRIRQRSAWRSPRDALASPELQFADNHILSSNNLCPTERMDTDCTPEDGWAITRKHLSPVFFNYT
jgi:hypothetical protein